MLGDHLPFFFAFPALVLASLLWRMVPGLVTALLCAAAVALPTIPPNLAPLERPLQVGAFLLASVFIALLCGRFVQHIALPNGADAANDPETPLTAWLRAVLSGALLIPTTAFLMVARWDFERAVREAIAGGLRVLPKPVAPEELLAELRSVLPFRAAAAIAA